METKLSASTRVQILTKRIEALKHNSDILMEVDERVAEIRRAEKALIVAYRDLDNENRLRDKIGRASKPIETAEQKFAKAMQRAGK